jgi:type I restriction enzyme, S subunit
MSDLPWGWARTTVAAVCLPIDRHDPREHPGETFNYIDIGGIDGHGIKETKRLTGARAPSRARQIVKAGDTVLSTVRTYLKKTALVPAELEGATASTGFCVLRPNAAIDSRFLFYRVIEPGFVAGLSLRQTGSSYPAVRDRDVVEQPIELPPLNEQRRIVGAIEEQFSRLDAAEESLVSARRKLTALHDRALETAFGGNWSWTTLGEIADIVGGVTKDAKRQNDPSFVEVPYLRVANVQRGYLDLSEITTIRVPEDKARALALRPGDVLFNEGGDRDKLGRGWIWSGEVDRCIHQNHVFRARLHDDFDPKFVSWHGNTFGRRWFEANGRQTTNLASLNLTTLKSFPVPTPPLDAQRQVVAALEKRLSEVQAVNDALDTAERRSAALRRSILERAFRGELVPQDPNDEPASALLERVASKRAAVGKPHGTASRRRRGTVEAK